MLKLCIIHTLIQLMLSFFKSKSNDVVMPVQAEQKSTDMHPVASSRIAEAHKSDHIADTLDHNTDVASYAESKDEIPLNYEDKTEEDLSLTDPFMDPLNYPILNPQFAEFKTNHDQKNNNDKIFKQIKKYLQKEFQKNSEVLANLKNQESFKSEKDIIDSITTLFENALHLFSFSLTKNGLWTLYSWIKSVNNEACKLFFSKNKLKVPTINNLQALLIYKVLLNSLILLSVNIEKLIEVSPIAKLNGWSFVSGTKFIKNLPDIIERLKHSILGYEPTQASEETYLQNHSDVSSNLEISTTSQSQLTFELLDEIFQETLLSMSMRQPTHRRTNIVFCSSESELAPTVDFSEANFKQEISKINKIRLFNEYFGNIETNETGFFNQYLLTRNNYYSNRDSIEKCFLEVFKCLFACLVNIFSYDLTPNIAKRETYVSELKEIAITTLVNEPENSEKQQALRDKIEEGKKFTSFRSVGHSLKGLVTRFEVQLNEINGVNQEQNDSEKSDESETFLL